MNKKQNRGSIITNHYSVINEVAHLESLYPANSREKEIAEIFQSIKNGRSLQLIALPGAGRANLLGFLAYNRNVRMYHASKKGQAQYHFVLCNFSEMKNRPLFDTVKFLFLELASSLHERQREEEYRVVDKLFKDALSYQDELVLFQELKNAIDFLTLEKNLTVTFLFERFETYIPYVTDAFFTNLRSIKHRAQYKFSVIFSVTRPLEDILEPELLADFYEFVADNHLYLSLYDPIRIKFRVHYLEKLTQKKIPQSTIDSILTYTAGHEKLTRLSLEAFLAENKQVIDEAFFQNKKTITSALQELWLFLTPDEQQDMRLYCKKEICPINGFLEDIGLLHEQKITIPLFQTFIAVQKEANSLHYIFEETTNSIKRGDVIISDQLTASEFRLFKLLLQNPGNIVDREQIIATVWSDTRTQEGVSEQALDQLVFRLRKKIEIDPNNPTHIQTIKGRGIRFIQ